MATAAELKVKAGKQAQQNFLGVFQALVTHIGKGNMAAQAANEAARRAAQAARIKKR